MLIFINNVKQICVWLYFDKTKVVRKAGSQTHDFFSSKFYSWFKYPLEVERSISLITVSSGIIIGDGGPDSLAPEIPFFILVPEQICLKIKCDSLTYSFVIFFNINNNLYVTPSK